MNKNKLLFTVLIFVVSVIVILLVYTPFIEIDTVNHTNFFNVEKSNTNQLQQVLYRRLVVYFGLALLASYVVTEFLFSLTKAMKQNRNL